MGRSKPEAAASSGDRLDSWKEIAAYLGAANEPSGVGKKQSNCRYIVTRMRSVVRFLPIDGSWSNGRNRERN